MRCSLKFFLCVSCSASNCFALDRFWQGGLDSLVWYLCCLSGCLHQRFLCPTWTHRSPCKHSLGDDSTYLILCVPFNSKSCTCSAWCFSRVGEEIRDTLHPCKRSHNALFSLCYTVEFWFISFTAETQCTRLLYVIIYSQKHNHVKYIF